MAGKGDQRDRIAAAENRIRELERIAARQGVVAAPAVFERIEPGEVTECIRPGTIDTPGEGAVRIYDAASGESGHVVRVKNFLPSTVPVGAACIIGMANGVWILIEPDSSPAAIVDCKGAQPTRYGTHALFGQIAENEEAVFKIAGEPGCWTLRCATPAELEGQAVESIDIEAVYDECADCDACWKLTKCDSDPPEISYTNTDLAEYKDRVVKLDDGYCYEVERAPNCLEAEPVELLDGYDDCETCQVCYELANCQDAEDTLLIVNNLVELAEEAAEEAGEEEPEEPLTPADMVGRVVRIAGVCYEVTATSSDCGEAEMAEVDELLESCSVCGCVKLTAVCAEPLPEPAVIYAHKATDECTGETIDLREFAGDGVIRLNDGYLYTVEETEDCDSTGEVTIQEHYGSGSPDLCPMCFRLESCDEEADVKTFEDLKGLGYEVGQILMLTDGEARFCYTIAEEIAWDAGCVCLGTEEHPVGDKWLDPRVYEDCDNCNQLTRYKLTNTDCIHPDCEGNDPADDIVTTSDLHAHIGKFVKYRGVCYKVSETEDEVTVADLGDYLTFDTCAECQEAEQTWSETIVTDVRAHAATLKIQMKQTTIQVTGKSNCDEDGGGWIDIDTGEECEE